MPRNCYSNSIVGFGQHNRKRRKKRKQRDKEMEKRGDDQERKMETYMNRREEA